MKKTRINFRMTIYVFIGACIGALLSVLLNFVITSDSPMFNLLQASGSFALMSGFIYLGFLISEKNQSRLLLYANRQVIGSVLLVSMLVLSLIAAVFQSILFSYTPAQRNPIVLVADRSGSMHNNDESAKVFLDQLSIRLQPDEEVTVYQFESSDYTPMLWKNNKAAPKTLFGSLKEPNGTSDFGGAIKAVKDNHSNSIVVFITDCEDFDDIFKNNHAEKIADFEALIDKGNTLVVVQISNTESQDLKGLVGENAYLRCQNSDASEKVAEFFGTSEVFNVQGLLMPDNNLPFNPIHCMMLVFMGILLGLSLFTATDFSKHFRPQLLVSALAGGSSYLILHSCPLPEFISGLWQSIIRVFLALLPYGIVITGYDETFFGNTGRRPVVKRGETEPR